MIEHDARKLHAAMMSIKIISQKMPKAMRSALHHTGQRLQTAAIRKARQEYVIKTGDVKKYGGLRVTQGQGTITLRSRGRNIPLIKFRTTPSRSVKNKPRTLKAAVKHGGKKPVRGAFVSRMSNGNVGVYRRQAKKRLPIDQLYGPAVPIMLNSARIRAELQQEMDERLGKRIVHETERINRELSRL